MTFINQLDYNPKSAHFLNKKLTFDNLVSRREKYVAIT